jgi:hypothetical protein
MTRVQEKGSAVNVLLTTLGQENFLDVASTKKERRPMTVPSSTSLVWFSRAQFKNATSRNLPAFAESPIRKGGDECEKGIHRSLLTAIASAAAVGEGGSASAGSAEDVKMPRAAARGASLSTKEDNISTLLVMPSPQIIKDLTEIIAVYIDLRLRPILLIP